MRITAAFIGLLLAPGTLVLAQASNAASVARDSVFRTVVSHLSDRFPKGEVAIEFHFPQHTEALENGSVPPSFLATLPRGAERWYAGRSVADATGGCMQRGTRCTLVGVSGVIQFGLPTIVGDAATIDVYTYADRATNGLYAYGARITLRRKGSEWVVTNEKPLVES